MFYYIFSKQILNIYTYKINITSDLIKYSIMAVSHAFLIAHTDAESLIIYYRGKN